MDDFQMTFKRYEIKYLLDEKTYLELRKRLEGKMVVDQYGEKTVCNIYFDTPDSRLLRSYGTPERNSTVFVELKKKYKGVVYKRREDMVLSEAEAYLYQGWKPGFSSQVLREIDWFLKYYGQITPAMYISYERIAMNEVKDSGLRVTFDTNILWRKEELNLKEGSWGNPILEPGQRLMEIKIAGAMPLWLGEILDKLYIYPVSFSKYGRAYQDQIKQEMKNRGGKNCA